MTVQLPPHIKTKALKRAWCQVTAVVPLCGADAELWLDQLFVEFNCLNWNVAWHLNNISEELRWKAVKYPRTIGFSYTEHDTVPYSDFDRTYATEIAQEMGAEWICCHDADETLEPKAIEMLPAILEVRKVHIARWYNIWQVGPNGRLLIRTDSPFVGYKTRFYPVDKSLGWQCCFRRGVSSMYLTRYPPGNPVWTDLRILHWGFSTPELRQRHYDQWRFGTATTEKVNSEYWNMLVESEWLDKVQLKEFDPDVSHQEFVTT